MAAPRATDTVVVVAGGDAVAPGDLPPGLAGARVIAADSGVDRAHALGLEVQLAIGDMDSVSGAGLDAVVRHGGAIDRHPAAKDATDLALALDAALALAPGRIVVVGGGGGRLDHLFAGALLLASPAYAGVEVVAQMGPARVTVVRQRAELHGVVGGLVSLVPVHGDALGVTTEGLLFPLADEDLRGGTTRGVSNELVAPTAVVHLRAGALLAIQPGPDEEAAP